jgi:lysophospholipase L1-like esterase
VEICKRIKNKIFKKVSIDINKIGQRDIDYENSDLKKYDRRFLIIGSSITLGWGVEYEETFSHKLNDYSIRNNKNWLFINGGVGNYNTERYVNNYLDNWKDLDFTDIIIQFFVNDTENLREAREPNFFVEHSHLGVIIWKLINSYNSKFKAEKIEDYYRELYDDDNKGFKIAVQSLKKIQNHCKSNNINCIIVNTPDIHQLDPYKLIFINDKMRKVSEDINFPYLDLLNSFKKYDAKDLWNKYGDPHPNNLGHEEMAKTIYKFLNK